MNDLLLASQLASMAWWCHFGWNKNGIIHSLVPRPLPFLPSICVHNNTPKRNFRQSSNSVYYCERKQEIKTGEAWDRGYTKGLCRVNQNLKSMKWHCLKLPITVNSCTLPDDVQYNLSIYFVMIRHENSVIGQLSLNKAYQAAETYYQQLSKSVIHETKQLAQHPKPALKEGCIMYKS